MPTLRAPAMLTARERAERHRLMARDALALASLFAIVLALTFVTYLLFHSFVAHRQALELRWKARADAAMRNGRPQTAIEDLRSALAYAPDDRSLEIELATALSLAGRTQEAFVYFTTLHESAPGDGSINLQLARLAVRQGNVPAAVEAYQAALDGTWNGDGVIRRREVRLELSRYLIAQHRWDEARNQLLIAGGNAADNHALQLTVAGLLEQAHGEADALHLYRKAMSFKDTRTQGLIGAGRTTAAQGQFLAARNLLGEATVQADFSRLSEDERAAVRETLDQTNQLLVLFPFVNLLPRQRAIRVAHDAGVAQARLNRCAANAQVAMPGPSTTAAAKAAPGATLRSALSAVQHARDALTGNAPGSAAAPASAMPPAETLTSLGARWQLFPVGAALTARMERDPAFLESTLQLVYQTEKVTAQVCGAPSGEDALLLKLAGAPDEIERQ